MLEAEILKREVGTFLRMNAPLLFVTARSVSLLPTAYNLTVARDNALPVVSTNLPVTCRLTCDCADEMIISDMKNARIDFIM
jgi:hypothetical protein